MHRLAILAAILAGAALIAWSSLGEWQVPEFGPPQRDYYNLLVSGFRKGSLALDVAVPEALSKAENPWDPLKRPSDVGAHDVSYFRGRYYIYFGVAPVVALFWPFRALTGHDLPIVYGTLAYSLGAFLIAAWLWLRILRDHFPGAGLGTRLAGVLTLGLAGGQLVLARRTSIWEPPIAAGHFYAVGMLAFGYLATRSRRPWGWLAASGLYLGLAVGSRPTLAAAGAGLAVIVAACARGPGEGGRPGRLRRAALCICAAGIPLGAVVAGLLAYNYARFGDALEFGIKYQMSSANPALSRHFSLSYFPFNFSVYFLKPPQWGRYFPFIHPISQPVPAPAGYYSIEYVYGALAVCPVIVWGLCLLGSVRGAPGRPGLPAIAWALAATAVATTAVLLSFDTAAGRYTVDFLPWWVWLGLLGWAALEGRIQAGWTRGRAALGPLRAAFLASAAFSVALAFFQSCELHGLLQYWSRDTYRRISRVFDAPTALAERIAGFRGGPIEMEVAFPRRPSGSYEPLVVTGVEYQKDYVYVFYQSDTVVRFGCHCAGNDAASADIAVAPGRAYPLRIECGSLYPPEGHPLYDGWSRPFVRSLKTWARVEFDGRIVLDARMPGNEASPGTVRIGRDQRDGTYGPRFTGTLSRVRRGPWRLSPADLAGSGDFELHFALPVETLPGNQPLIVAGRPGMADLFGARTLDRGHFGLLYESWGNGLWQGRPIAMPDTRSASLRVRFGPLLGINEKTPLAVLRRTLVVWKDGTPVWWRRTEGIPEPGASLGLFENTIGSTGMLPEFQGRIDSAARDPGPRAWRSGPFSAAELELAGRGNGTEPLVATGGARRRDTLAIRWLSGERAQLVYDHSGGPPRLSWAFSWPDGTMHRVRCGLPSLAALDAPGGAGPGEGPMRVDLDGRRIWEERVPFFPSPSSSVSVGGNPGDPAGAGGELSCVVVDLRQAFR